MVATCGAESCFSIPTSYVSDFVDTVRGALGPVYAMRGVAQLKATPLLCGPGCRVTTSSALIPRGASPSHDGNYEMAMRLADASAFDTRATLTDLPELVNVPVTGALVVWIEEGRASTGECWGGLSMLPS
jgi:hypothetical protein